jgi:hypothetical protein
MAATADYTRKRAVTPINDFAQISRRGKSITNMNTLRFHYQLKRSNMFSLAMRGIKIFGYLFVTLLLLLLVLNFQLVHDGNGRFRVSEKPKWAFTETFVTKSNIPNRVNNQNALNSSVRGVTETIRVATDTLRGPSDTVRAVRDIEGAAPEGAFPNQAALSSAMECAANRTNLAEAVNKYNSTHRNAPMRDLEIFSLLSDGYINELSDCPMGGQYTLKLNNRGQAEISCSSH